MSAIRSFRELKDEALDESRQTGNPAMEARIGRWLNECMLDLASTFDFQSLYRRVSVSLTAAAQTSTEWPEITATLPMDVAKIRQIELRDDNSSPSVEYPVEVYSHGDFVRLTQGQLRSAVTGRPLWAAMRRIEGARQDVQDVSAQTYQAASDKAEITPTPKVMVGGWTDAARRNYLQEEISLSATANIYTDFANTYFSIDQLGKSKDSAGIVTFRVKTVNTVIGQIMPWDRNAWYNVLEWYPFPDLTYTAWIEYKMIPPFMTLDSHTPAFLPAAAHRILAEYAKGRALLFAEDKDNEAVGALMLEARARFQAVWQPDSLEHPAFQLERAGEWGAPRGEGRLW